MDNAHFHPKDICVENVKEYVSADDLGSANKRTREIPDNLIADFLLTEGPVDAVEDTDNDEDDEP